MIITTEEGTALRHSKKEKEKEDERQIQNPHIIILYHSPDFLISSELRAHSPNIFNQFNARDANINMYKLHWNFIIFSTEHEKELDFDKMYKMYMN